MKIKKVVSRMRKAMRDGGLLAELGSEQENGNVRLTIKSDNKAAFHFIGGLFPGKPMKLLGEASVLGGRAVVTFNDEQIELQIKVQKSSETFRFGEAAQAKAA